MAQISGRSIVLVLDQWEQSPDPKLEAKTLNAFLHHLDDWPACHLFMALRSDEPAHGEVEKLADSLPGTAEIYPLGEMDLGPEEGHRLTAFVRDTIRAAAAQSDDDLLQLVDGYPGVLYQWTRDYQRAHMHTLADLEKVADDAQNYRFSDLKELLPKLDSDQRRLATRLALLPVGGGLFEPLKNEIVDELAEELIDDLRLSEVLEEVDPPSFGHAKRWEAARTWFIDNRKAATRTEAEALILRLAASVRAADPSLRPNLVALWGLRVTSDALNLSPVAASLCELPGLGLDVPIRLDSLISGAPQARTPAFAAIAPLLAMGLFDGLNAAKAEDDLARRDALLAELRALAGAHPADAAVRENLAMGLVNTLNHAKAEDDLKRRDALLEELRALAAAHPANAAVREQLAMGLFNTLNHAKAEDDLARRDALLEELRALAGAHPADAAVREPLAKGLVNTLNHSKAEDDLARRDALLEELRALAGAHPADAAVREQLAMGVARAMLDADDEGRPERREELLEELNSLAEAHPDDGWVERFRSAGLLG